jgi:F-type H+-transporting ATPase subunit b
MKKRMGIGVAIAGGAAALPWPALASAAKGGLPQLDASLYPGQLFWLAICFPLLFVLMRFIAVPRVKTSLDNRREVLRTDLEKAAADDKEAMALREDYEQALATARSRAQASVSEMTQAAGREEAERRAEQQKELAERVAQAEARVAKFREEALKEAREAAADLAEAIVAKLIGPKKATR